MSNPEPTTTYPFPTAQPALPPQVYVPFTVVFIILYLFIFVFAYVQLVLILYYKYKRVSYQSGLLYLNLFWSALRICLFSFYFKNADLANKLPFGFYFCLYCLPVVLQFATLCLLVLYYGQTYFRIATRVTRERNNILLRLVLSIALIIFVTCSIVSAYFSRVVCTLQSQKNTCSLFQIAVIRVAINDLLFVIFGFLMGAYLFKIASLSLRYSIPVENNISMVKAMFVTVCTAFLLITRTLYNLLAITVDRLKLPDFGFDFLNVSDQADFVNLTEKSTYITFGCVLLIWELIPAFVIIFLFRIRNVNEGSSFDEFTSLSASFGVTPKDAGRCRCWPTSLFKWRGSGSGGGEREALFGESTGSLANMNYYSTINTSSHKSVFLDAGGTGQETATSSASSPLDY